MSDQSKNSLLPMSRHLHRARQPDMPAGIGGSAAQTTAIRRESLSLINSRKANKAVPPPQGDFPPK